MAYTLLIKKEAKKNLQRLSRPDKNRIAEKIFFLRDDPDNPDLDVKKLQGEPYFRLRVGKWRIIFDRQDEIRNHEGMSINELTNHQIYSR
jgi:mRNA interferase RelE/StbE